MPRKRTALANPTEAVTVGSPSSAVITYKLSPEEIAAISARVKKQIGGGKYV